MKVVGNFKELFNLLKILFKFPKSSIVDAPALKINR